MKRSTLQEHNKIANNVLYHIYTHIDAPISIRELARHNHTSPAHLQRIFKEVFETTIHQTIISIRLEKAANLLVVNRHSTISEIAQACGYSSLASFIEAFKKRFGMGPKEWREKGFLDYSQKILGDALECFDVEYEIVQIASIPAYYIRHRGYDASIKECWQKLRLFALSNGIEGASHIALYHDNPAIKPLKECAYVATLATSKRIKDANLPRFWISGGIYAKFHIEGKREDELRFIHWVYHRWLASKGFETTPKPAFAIYYKNPYLEDELAMDYYISVRL